ncbi:MAG: glycosyltransferase family 2 protein [bacterium JZ-2024 1]
MKPYSVIIPSCQPSPLLSTLISSLSPEAEILLVWNSRKGFPTETYRKLHPQLRILSFPDKIGYARACNAGAQEAHSDILVFLNDDVRLKDNWWEQASSRLSYSDCVAFLILDAKGQKVDYGGGAINLFGYGISLGNGKKIQHLNLKEEETLFPCGAGFAIFKDIFINSGGFDEDYFAFFEDVDLGWRLNLLGYKVLFCPDVVVFHASGSSTRNLGVAYKQHLLQRNSLFSLFKNYEDAHLLPLLSSALTSAVKKISESRRKGKWNLASAYRKALTDFLALLPAMEKKRQWVQQNRKKSDKEILPLFRLPVHPAHLTDLPQRYLQESLRFLTG